MIPSHSQPSAPSRVIEAAAIVGSLQELRKWSQSQPDREPPIRPPPLLPAMARVVAAGEAFEDNGESEAEADDEGGGGVSGEGSRTSSNPYRHHGFGSVTDIAQVGDVIGWEWMSI